MTFALAALAAAPAARAAQCGKPDLVDTIPADGADGVPRNAKLGAHYTAATEYLGEAVLLVHPAGNQEVLPATWDATEQLLQVTPSAPLDAGQSYEVRWPSLRGLNAAAPGLGGTARFTTGTLMDAAAPTFTGVTSVAWDLERMTNDCVDEIVERFVFDIDLGVAGDDGGTSGLTLMLFETKGPMVTGTPMPIPARAWPKDGMRAQVKLAKGDSLGEICFAGIVRDTIGQISQSGDVEACVHTTDPPFFNGCSVSGAGTSRAEIGGSLAGLAIVLLVRRRRTRMP
jgi:MYXO-CTERM domain-containing protein